MSKTIKNFKFMKRVLILSILICTLFFWSCRSNAQEHNEKEKTHKEESGHDKDREGHGKEVKGHDKDGEHQEAIGEHARDKDEGGEGEEDGTQFNKQQTYNVIKHGVQLVLKYDKQSNAFNGYMLNTSNKNIERARVEVHLSNGTELGPTKPITLVAKMKQEVVLKATEKPFKTWSTHAEVGNNEHGDNSERGEGHSAREKGEH